MSVRDIQAHVAEIYGTEVSPDLISRVTEAVTDEGQPWQAHPLDPLWRIVFRDALVLKVRDQGIVHKSAYIALGGRRQPQGSASNSALKQRAREVLAQADQ